MADYDLVQVSELTATETPANTDVLPIQQGTTLKKITYANLKSNVVSDEANARQNADNLKLNKPTGGNGTSGQMLLTNGDGTTQWASPDATLATTGKAADAKATGDAIKAVDANLAAPYSTSATYAVGDYCTKDGQLYRCTTAITTAEAWTSGHWSAVALGGDVSTLRSALNDLPFFDDYQDINIVWTRTDKYISYNGAERSLAYYYQSEIAVTAGEKYLLTGTNDYAKAIYATLDANNVPVRHPRTGNNNNLVPDIEIIIADNETKLVLQTNATDRSKYILKKYTGIKMDDAVVGKINLKTEVTNILPASSFVNFLNLDDADVVAGKYINRDGSMTDNSYFLVSGYIPIEQNVDYQYPVYVNYFGASSVIYVPYYNAEKTYISFATGVYDSSTQLLTVKFTNVGAAYTRINIAKIGSYLVNTLPHNPEAMMFAKAPYPDEFVPYGEQNDFAKNVYMDLEAEQKANPLFRKTAIFLGDSICNGASAQDGKNGWAGRIGRKNQMKWLNTGISGGTFTSGLTGSAGVISDVDIQSDTPAWNTDYIIIEGGTNDADLIGSVIGGNTPEKFGSFNMADFTSDFTNTTYCGAIEYLIQKAITAKKGAKIGFIIAPKMGQLNTTYTDYTAEHNNRRAYFKTLIEICEKWGIPYLNLWDECYLNPMIPAHYTSGEDYMYTDGQHLTAKGYDYISPIIEAWMKTL